MSPYKVLSAIMAAALGTAVGMVLPGPSVEAGTTNPAITADVPDNRPLGHDCAHQAWPYYAPSCLHYRTQASGEE
jgi:hypothetical protein